MIPLLMLGALQRPHLLSIFSYYIVVSLCIAARLCVVLRTEHALLNRISSETIILIRILHGINLRGRDDL